MFTPKGMKTSISLVAIVFAAMSLSGCEQEKAEAAKPEVRPVKVVEVEKNTTGQKLEYSGSVRSRTEMNLAFRVAGKITERLVDIGDRVKKGDVLARLDPTDYRLAMESAKANLDSATKALETARLANERAKALFESHAVPKSQVEQAQLAYDQANSARIAASASLDQAENQLSYTDLKSDREGIVASLSAERGQVVSAGSPVLTVVADDEKEVQIAVPESEISRFRPGDRVRVSFWADDRLEMAGTVREVSASADPQSRTFSVRVSLPKNDTVLIGMTATVKTEGGNGEGGLIVPLTALSQRGNDKIVWTVDPAQSKVHARTVSVSSFTDGGVDVASGLKPGDLVVAAGVQFMRENLTVKLPGVGELTELVQ